MPNYLLTESGDYVLTESGDRILLDDTTTAGAIVHRRPELLWPPHPKPGPGAHVAREPPPARGLTRCHIYQATAAASLTLPGRDFDLLWGKSRTATFTNAGKRLAPGLVGWALNIPNQGSPGVYALHAWSINGLAGGEAHGDWDPEENGTKPRAPFTAAVLLEATTVPTSNWWPMVLLCQNFSGTRAGFEIAMFNQTTEDFPNFVAWTSGSSNTSTYGRNPGGTVRDGKPHLIVGGVNQQGYGWCSLDGRPPVYAPSPVTSGTWNMRGKNISHGLLESQGFARISDTRVGGWMFWKRELRPEEPQALWTQLYGGLIREGPYHLSPGGSGVREYAAAGAIQFQGAAATVPYRIKVYAPAGTVRWHGVAATSVIPAGAGVIVTYSGSGGVAWRGAGITSPA